MYVVEFKIVAKTHQFQAIDEAIRTTQFVRNKALRYWMDAPRDEKVNGYALSKLAATLRKEFDFVKRLNSMACQAATERAWFAISRFFDNCKKQKSGKKGYPRFQKDNRSVEYKTSGWKLHPEKRRVTFTDGNNIGELKLLGSWDLHRIDPKTIKRVRILRRADGYFCQFCIKAEISKDVRVSNHEIGIDLGLNHFYSDSEGYQEENPRFLRKAEEQIKKNQRRIYKKIKGSNNRRKARKRYASVHLKVSRQRIEHAKRVARCVCKHNSFVAYEDLRVSNMVKNRKLAKSISDVSWSLFVQWLKYFAGKFETTVIAVNPAYTSQLCSNCGHIVKKSLSTRTHRCTKCGYVEDRDVNAAKNILSRAKSREGHSRSNA